VPPSTTIKRATHDCSSTFRNTTATTGAQFVKRKGGSRRSWFRYQADGVVPFPAQLQATAQDSGEVEGGEGRGCMMETVIFTLSAIAGLAAGLALGGLFWGHHSDTVKAQADEIDALNLNNLRLRGQCAELATMAHDGSTLTHMALIEARQDDRSGTCLCSKQSPCLPAEIDSHSATKRKLSAAKGQITKLRKAQ
jgi:hypothetical protein